MIRDPLDKQTNLNIAQYVIDLGEQRDRLQEERDALLEACEAALDALDYPEQKSNRAWAAIELLEAAIEKAKGE